LFKPPRLDDPDVDRLLKRVGKLKRLFIGANGERKVLGFMEELGNTGKQLMDVEFRGFKADLCEAYYAKSDVSSKVKCEPIVKGNEFYYSLKSVNENFGETELSHWQDATAKLRIANTALVDSGSGIAPVVVKPVNDQSLDKNEGLKLEAREDSNARTYYYDLDVRKDDNGEDVFNGEIFGRDVRLDVISEHYDIPEGYHKIGLIEIGKNGMPYTATVDICINSEKDTDNDGQNDGCDKDDDNDGVPDSGDGDYFVGNKPCRGSSSGCDDNCPTVANSDQADSDGDGVGDACSQDRDNDGFFNHEDAFPDDPAASKNCDDAEEAEGAKKPDKWNPRATPDQIAASGLTIDDDDDNDGLLDTLEPLGCECDKDCDGDGMGDFEEVSLGRNPASVDSDGDGLRDDEEAAFGANPTLVDTDGDTLGDYREVKELGTKPDTPDSDSDGMDDGYEVEYGLDPNVNDASGDKDNDGLSNLEEKRVGSYPNDPDSDNDRICDGNKEVLGVCAAGPDQTPIKADAPEIVSTVPEQGANVVFQNKIELETKGDATCKLSLTREVFYEDFTKDFVSTGNKHVYDDLIKDGGINPVPLIKSGSNTIYIMCRGAADMEQPFELVFTNDRDPLSVSETSPDKADSFDDIEIKFKTSRTADCKLATSEEGLDSGVSATTSDGFTHTGKVSIVPEAKKLLSDCQNAVTETVVDEDGNTLDSAEFAQGRAGYYYGCRSFMGDGSCDSRPEPIKSICKDVKKYSEATLAGDAELCKDFSQEGLLEVCKYVTSNVNPEDSFCSDDVDCKVLLKLGNALKNSDRQLCESFDEANTFGTDFLAKAVCKARLDNNINYCTSHGCNFVYENRYQVFGQCKDRTTESFLRAPFEVAFPVDKEASPDPLR
jgi:hypothetical protein